MMRAWIASFLPTTGRSRAVLHPTNLLPVTIPWDSSTVVSLASCSGAPYNPHGRVQLVISVPKNCSAFKRLNQARANTSNQLMSKLRHLFPHFSPLVTLLLLVEIVGSLTTALLLTVRYVLSAVIRAFELLPLSKRYGTILSRPLSINLRYNSQAHYPYSINTAPYNATMSLVKILSNVSVAASLLQDNRNVEATQVLARDVRSMHSGVLGKSLDSFRSSLDFQVQPLEAYCRVYSVDTPKIKSDMCISPDNVFKFYRKAFCVETFAGVDPSLVANQLTGILMYNLALGYHREGIRRGSTKILERALGIYNVALVSFRQCSGQGVERFLFLAVANNIGHIHAIHFDMDKAQACQRLMAECMDGCQPRSGDAIEEDLFYHYLQSVFFGNHELSCAPVA